MIRLLVADDHPLILLGVRSLLSNVARFEIVGEAHNPESLLAQLATTPCEVLVTDFSMPDSQCSDGLAMLGVIRRRYPDIRTIVLTGLRNSGLIGSMLQEGVAGILSKRGDMAELPIAIELVLQRKIYLGRCTRQDIERLDLSLFVSATGKALSPSELEVIRLYASGLTVSGIAEQLRRSVKTISTHKRSAMEKLGLRSDAELCHYATGNGLG